MSNYRRSSASFFRLRPCSLFVCMHACMHDADIHPPEQARDQITKWGGARAACASAFFYLFRIICASFFFLLYKHREVLDARCEMQGRDLWAKRGFVLVFVLVVVVVVVVAGSRECGVLGLRVGHRRTSTRNERMNERRSLYGFGYHIMLLAIRWWCSYGF